MAFLAVYALSPDSAVIQITRRSTSNPTKTAKSRLAALGVVRLGGSDPAANAPPRRKPKYTAAQ